MNNACIQSLQCRIICSTYLQPQSVYIILRFYIKAQSVDITSIRTYSLLNLNTERITEQKMGRLERLLNKADDFKEAGRFEEALKELTKAIEIAPYDPDVHLSIALTYDAMEDFETSIRYFRKSLNLNSEDPYIWTQLGITLSRMSRYSESIDAFEQALEIDPEHVFSKWHLALAYRTTGLYEDALRNFEECLDSDSDLDYIKDEIHYQLGLCYFDMGWTREAVTEFRKHVEICPNDNWAHLSIGNCYFDFGWIDESAAKFREVIAASPAFIPAYNSLALSLAEKGWYDDALDVLRAALQIAPEDESLKDNMDYIQSLKDDDDGNKGIVLLALIMQMLQNRKGKGPEPD